MFGLAKKPTPGLVLLLLIPAFLILFYFSLARSTGAPAHAPARITRAEPELNADLDHDGLPDTAELRTFNDRENFRRWFTWVAEMQFYNLSDQWNTEQRDCAGLVRFAFREALRPHDRPWFQRMGENYDPVAPDLTPKHRRDSRTENSFAPRPAHTRRPTSLTARFSEFADAQTLKHSTSISSAAIAARQNLAICFSFTSHGSRSIPFTS